MVNLASRERVDLSLATALVVLATGCGRFTESSDDRPAPDEPATSQPSTSSPRVGISAEEDATIPPGPPGTVNVSHRDGVHVVDWKGTRDDTIVGYEVYRRCGSGDWNSVGSVALRPDDGRNRGTYVLEDEFKIRCEYTVAAVNAAGKPGPKSIDIQ
jgi:hypothetical protein